MASRSRSSIGTWLFVVQFSVFLTVAAVNTCFAADTIQKLLLTVTKLGTGGGKVTSTPAGIDCGSNCAVRLPNGTRVTLTAVPNKVSRFVGWSGACTGKGTCEVRMNEDKPVIATFLARQLSVNKLGAGAGTVVSTPAGIDCGTSCTKKFRPGTAVTLQALSGKSSRFIGWGSPCSGTGTCQITLTGDTAVTAMFAKKAMLVNSTADAVDAAPGDGVCATQAGVCSLRAAIQEGNALPGLDTVTLPPGTYSLSLSGENEDQAATGDLDINANTRILGWSSRNTVVDGTGMDNIFDIQANAHIAGVSLQNSPGSGIRVRGAANLVVNRARLNNNGHGLQAEGSTNSSTTLLNNVVVENNTEGGIVATYSTVRVHASSIQNNTAANAGGGISNTGGLLIVDRSTVSGNRALGVAPSSGVGGGIYNTGNVRLSNATVSGNSAEDGVSAESPGSGGGLYLAGGAVALDKSTVFGNRGTVGANLTMMNSGVDLLDTVIAGNVGGSNCARSGGNSTTYGANLDSDGSCSLSAKYDLNRIDPLLQPLKDNGGFTLTHLPRANSPLLNSGNTDYCTGYDQRAVLRPRGNRCEIGAVESGTAPHPAPVDVFNLEVGNYWEYRDDKGSVSTVEVKALDANLVHIYPFIISVEGYIVPPPVLYRLELRDENRQPESDMYEITPSSALLWGGVVTLDGAVYHLHFSQGLPAAWYPLQVGSRKTVNATATIDEFRGLSATVNHTATVVAKQNLALAFGRVDAYEVQSTSSFSVLGRTVTRGLMRWVVPNVGVVAYSDDGGKNIHRLINFAAQGRLVTQATDFDGDGIKDYRDNCVIVANVDQRDANNNDVGDSCEVTQ